MKIPILIVVPMWKGDFTQAIEVCKITAGLQPHHVKHEAHVMLVCRQDFGFDQNMIKIISAKFNTLTYRSSSPLRGWPNGANGMFGNTMIHISNNLSKTYDAIFWMEPDCVPIRTNWFCDLHKEWKKRHSTAHIIGCRHDCNGDGSGDHITGCAIYDPNIARILPEITRSDGIAWDYEHRAKIVAMGGGTKLIQNWYKAKNADPGIIEQGGVVAIHGFKDLSLCNIVKKKFKIS